MVVDLPGALDAAVTDVELLGGLGLGGRYANWRLSIRPLPMTKRRQPVRSHGPLAGAEVPAAEVEVDDKLGRLHDGLPYERLEAL